MALTKSEIRVLLKHIEPQGVETKRTKDGVLLKLPNGETAMIHFTGSDFRGHMPLRGTLKKAGVTWPWDGYVAPKIKEADAMGNPIDGPRRPNHKTLDTLRPIIERMHRNDPSGLIDATALFKESKLTVSTTVYKALAYWGYTLATDGERSRAWVRPEVYTGIKPPQIAAPVIEPDEEPGEYPELQNARTLVAPPPKTREFIDTHDSWTVITNSSTVGELTVRQLRQTLMASGLAMEIRVWRADPTEQSPVIPVEPAMTTKKPA